ncbi:porin family protein [Nonlabens ulvanivorans]|uniref:porin family protein n=2 Tax=Nonlabens ulvanivorans TaxID=906888 RepID=UPI003263F144
MKKILLSAAIAVFGIGAVQAQDNFGLKGGVNFADLGGDENDVETLTAFHIGGFAQFEISDTFMIQPELLYSSQGAQSEEDSELKFRLNYINVPIMAKLLVADGLSAEIGPQFGFAVSKKLTYDGDSEDLEDIFKSFDYGVGLGASYEFSGGLMLSLRYNLGLANIAGDELEDIRISNNVGQISIGYTFN